MTNFSDNSLFSGLSADQIGSIKKYFESYEYKAGDIIIEEDSVGGSMFLLLEGEIIIDKSLIPLFEQVKINPEDKKIINIKDDTLSYFGEMSMFDTNFKRSASILAKTDTKVAFLSKDDFENIIDQNPEIGIMILKNIGLKLSHLLDLSNVELSKLITAFTMSLKL
ncbi:MAG: cyclic nucleotide-binding domain-containing protein [Candidatus Delongbacteria bacterium]|jgi:signal-transduction protein with cAMP-binding, CBS, and nucleotidyltransferase domain|nr:cyclic nucleotide-binding domain-containing protein [Candidatus Delongbacteria bacterium]